jgi:hypothetical protein
MNPLLRLLVLVVAGIAIGGYGVHVYLHQKTEMEAKVDLIRTQREFEQRASAAREINGNEDYGDEMRGLLKWYFSSLRDHDNRYPDFRDHDVGWKDLLHKNAVGAIKGQAFEDFKQNREAVQEVYKLLSTGGYDPLYSAAASGMHFDLWKIGRETHEGKPELRIDFVWWGPQRRVDMESRNDGATTYKRVSVSATIQSLDLTLLDEDGKVYGEMHGQNGGEPAVKIPDPDRYVDLFPSMAVLGTYWLDLFPHEAQKLGLELNVSTHTAQGHDLPAKFSWQIPIKDDWRLAPGEKWEGATEETREPEETDAKQASAGRVKHARLHR